jgi:formylglycine-generating enzyme required for sulfatase activity
LGQYVHFGQPLDSGKPLSVRNHDKKANAWDMEMISGNTFHWVYDGYQDGLQGGKDPVEHNDDYGEAGRQRVFRGGGWLDVATGCGSANRSRDDPTNRDPSNSLRLALSSSGVYGFVQGEKK